MLKRRVLPEMKMLRRTMPPFSDLRAFVGYLESRGQLARVAKPISVVHELTEIHCRVLKDGGPALLFEQPIKANGAISEMPILVNLFGTVERVAWGLGIVPEALPALGETLAEMRNPVPPRSLQDAWSKLPLAVAALSMRPRTSKSAEAQTVVLTGDMIGFERLPAQIPWPKDAAPLITWPLVITRPPDSSTGEENVGVYRMQVLGRDRAIMRWLAHRGGARHHHQWKQLGRDMPVAVVIGADPATILSAVLPLPENMSEIKFSGILRGKRPALLPCVSVPLAIPSEAEIVIEGMVSASETAPEGPYGDHTGYYNAVEEFPVMRVTAITMRKDPIYLSTFTGRPPDEPSRIGEAFNKLFLPLARRQFPEIIDLWLPPEACSYRIAVASISKRYPGQARRLMLGLWSMLPQFTYTKFLIIVDGDINVRNWADVMWAVSTRSDPSRDLVVLSDTPIDYLDFASVKSGLGGKLGVDATTKIGPEISRPWGEVLVMDPTVVARVNSLWCELGLPQSGLKGKTTP
jgi:4-hydroxy-3-polyprenylbenzoate decarboxylase